MTAQRSLAPLVLLAIVSGIATAACEQRGDREIAIACRWVMYGEELDSFVFNLGRNEVYLANEDARYPITELTEGRIGFTGTRSELRVGEAEVLRDVTMRFSIDRVTGELYIDGVAVPDGYNNSCAVTEKVL